MQAKHSAPLRIPPKLAMINDIAGYGRCSTTESLPIISAMKVQACLVPTSLFSNHTGFPVHFMHDCTPYLRDYLSKWNELEFRFDGIYCGFLGSAEQVEIVREYLDSCPELLFILDPVMGDHGKAYRTVTPEHCSMLRHLLSRAAIITPNITEACLLTDTPYRDGEWSMEELSLLTRQLHAMGPQKIVITGLRDGADYVNFLSERITERSSALLSVESPDCIPLNGSSDCISLNESPDRLSPAKIRTGIQRTPSAGHSWHGTGDIFASIIAADAVNGVSFAESVEKAAHFVGTCIRASIELGIPEKDGVCFENFLHLLIPQP